MRFSDPIKKVVLDTTIDLFRNAYAIMNNRSEAKILNMRGELLMTTYGVTGFPGDVFCLDLDDGRCIQVPVVRYTWEGEVFPDRVSHH